MENTLPTEAPQEVVAQPTEQTEQAEQPTEQPKDEDPRDRELRKLRNALSRKNQTIGSLRERLSEKQLTPTEKERDNGVAQGDNDTLSLPRKDVEALILEEAKKLAPQIKQQEAEVEKRRSVVTGLVKNWGEDKFRSLTNELTDAFEGTQLLPDGKTLKPAIEALFESDIAGDLIEYLADSDNAAEAERLSRMSPVQAGRAITRLEDKLKSEKAKAKPEPSKAAPPIEPTRGGGTTDNAPRDNDSVEVWVRKERARLAAKKG